jgi:O-antigen ligase
VPGSALLPPRETTGPLRLLDRAGLAITLLLPLFLMHGRGIAEALLIVLGALFVARSLALRDWGWLRAAWVRIGLAWWVWLVFCSVSAGAGPLVQAVGLIRFLLLVAALEHWTLRDVAARIWLARLLRWAALYIALQSLVQFATGRNLYGYPRGADGELTGPYANPRAGPPMSRLLFPALLPVVNRWTGMAGWWPLAGTLLALAGMAVMVLIGQRMPLLLTFLGLFVTALLLPRLRAAVLFSLVAAGLLLAVAPVVSPPAFNRLVTKFSTQMEHFPDSPYGQIAARAMAITAAHPVTGAGFDAFRRLCDDPRYFQGWNGGDGGEAAICVQHPHNHYLQALTEAGIPGFLLFSALVLAWLHGVGRGLWREPDPLRVGLFVAVLIQEWPIASASAFSSMPLSGWFFVLLGLGLAETRAYMTAKSPSRTPHV